MPSASSSPSMVPSGSNGFGAPWWVVTPAGEALQN
jgi:hypothetical protein